MMDKRLYFLKLARRTLAGEVLDAALLCGLLTTPEDDLLPFCAGADLLREAHFGRTIHLCAIHNGKSGRCSEDCSFCSQSIRAKTDAPLYPLQSVEELAAPGKRLEDTPVNRYSIVTSGRGLSPEETRRVAQALSQIDPARLATCASLGIIGKNELEALKTAGVTRYHHNLETAASHFAAVCTTHTYEQRLRTLQEARRAGLSLCCGGIFGLGESDDQILELALTLRELRVDSVPVNFLTPIPGTAAAGLSDLTPLRCLKIIAFLRYALPDREIIVCGGRQHNLKELHPLIFYAGASGLMTGDYLTTAGRRLDNDLALLRDLGLTPRPGSHHNRPS